MHFLNRILLLLLFSTIFYYVLNYIDPPASWPQATTSQILAFFLPLLGLLTFLINLFLKQILRSFVAALGLMFALVLMADKNLTPLNAAITFFITGILFTYTPKFRALKPSRFKKTESSSATEKHVKPPRLIKRL